MSGLQPSSLSGAISAVINRAEDCGLRELAQRVQLAHSPVRQHFALIAALRAAEALHASALHFNQRPIASCAEDLEKACLTAVAALDRVTAEALEADGRRNPGDFTYQQWLANGGRPPAREVG